MTSPTLAGPPGDCCVTGVKHSGTPVGKTVTIAGVETYVSEPPAGTDDANKKVLLFLADVWGPFYLNNQLLQDYFATQGFIVVGLDYFFGDPIYIHNSEPDFDREAWMKNAMKKSAEAFPGWVEAVKEIYGANAKYCTVGYCFGAPFTLDLAATDSVDASAIAHPAFLNEDHFKHLKKPLLLSCAEIDHTFSLNERRRAEDILIEIKATYHFQVFSGVSHGFAVRGDPEVENARWAKEESARLVTGWFKRFLADK